jgi:hypothetical protein
MQNFPPSSLTGIQPTSTLASSERRSCNRIDEGNVQQIRQNLLLTAVPYTIRLGTDCTTVSMGMAKFTPDEIPDPAQGRFLAGQRFSTSLHAQDDTYIYAMSKAPFGSHK